VKERLLSLTLALGALALFWALLIPKPGIMQEQPVMPLSTESGSSGYLGMWRWLRTEGVSVMSLRERYALLLAPGTTPAPSGNVLFTTMPHALPVRVSELASLDDWIRRGNTLVLMVALDDTPMWSAAADASFVTRLAQISQLHFELIPTSPSPSPSAPQATARLAVALTPIGKHPLLAGVESIATLSDQPGSRWRAIALARHTCDPRTAARARQTSRYRRAGRLDHLARRRQAHHQCLCESVCEPTTRAVR
jgi:hypothetical protein